eukprot:jgi/Mesen1/7249/ME000373S06324
MAVSVAAEWDELTDRFYCKREIYTMCWKGINLANHMVACGRFGGPIAIIRDQNKLLLLGRSATAPRVRILNAAGVLISSFAWDRPGGKLVQMGWTDEEVLICVVESGQVYQYNIHGALLPGEVDLGRECYDAGVAQCAIWGSGVACLSKSNQLYAILDLKEPAAVKLAWPGAGPAPHCMAIIEPHFTVSGQLEVLLAVGSSIVVVDQQSARDQGLSIGPVACMAMSPSGSVLAAFTHEGKLLVLQSDFTKTLSEFDTQSHALPCQVAWCGSDSVVAHFLEDQSLLMVGPYGDSLSYSYDDTWLALVPECDGLRILTSTRMEFLHRVPDSTVEIFRFGSTAPGALLFDAMDHFERRSAKADENLRMLMESGQLAEAVETCIDAASHEFDAARQVALLRAAAYGRAFCRSFPKERMAEACKTLRVLNAVRHFEAAGIPLTLPQYQMLTGKVLVARLEPVLVHWAAAKIAATSDAPDSILHQLLLDKLQLSKKISYAAIAENAYLLGRPKLAALLLDHEPRASEQVRLLAAMQEGARALGKALDSGDTHLNSLADVVKILNSRPAARDLFISFAKQTDTELLKRYYAASAQPQGVAELVVREAWEAARSSHTPGGRHPTVSGVRLKLLEQAGDLYGQTKNHVFHSKACEEHVRLLKVQQDLETKTGQRVYVDTSVSDTLRTCIALGHHASAQKIRTEFKACVEEGARAEGAKYIPKIADLQERAEAYARVGMMAEAADAASQAKDGELLARIRSTLSSQNTAATALFDSLRDKLSLASLGPSQ